MGENVVNTISTVIGGILVLAVIATLVGSSNTGTIITDAGTALSNTIKAATTVSTSSTSNSFGGN